MDEYQYPLFFEAKGLTDTERKTIRIYFQERQVSGGGDCAAVQAVGGDVYKIFFKEKEDQERVLQKKHVVSFPFGNRHLIMIQTGSSRKPDESSTQTFTKPNTKEREMCWYHPELLIHSDMIAMEEFKNMIRFEASTFYNKKTQVFEKGVNCLSSKVMVEAEEPVKRNLSVKTLKLQGVTAVPPDLDQVKEILNKAMNVANSGEIRVDISFIPVGTTMTEVRLVGYSENVNQLEKVLCDYQTNQAHTQESLNLPIPELVYCLDEVLDLIGLDHTKVTLKTSTTPNPCVLLSGPRCHVDEVKQALISALSHLTSDTLVLDGPGAQQFFQAEGKKYKDLIESSFQVLIKEHPGVNSTERSPIEGVRHVDLEDQQLTSPEVGKNLLTNNVLTLMVVPGVRLHMVFGDITHETTDAIVNSTNFEHLEHGVCKAILTAAGPAVKTKVKAAKVNRGSIFKSKGGLLPCKAILHVNGKTDAGLIESLVCDLILHCESCGYRSIAIPAICAGEGGMDAGVVAQAILRGVKTAASSTPLRCVTDIRLVLIVDIVFLLFKEEALKVFSTDVVERVSLPHEQQNPQRSGTSNPSILSTSFDTQKSVFLFLGLCGKKVSDAKMKLKQLYQDQCLTHTFTAEEVGSLSEDDTKCLQQLADKEGLNIQSVQGNMTVSGLKDGVNSVIKEFLCSNLRRLEIVREEEDLHSRVAWCILGSRGNWARLPKTANHRLEHNNLAGGIMDEQSNQWTVDLQRMEAKGQVTGEIRKLKRLKNLPDFTLPLYWDNMAAGEDMKVVTLEESSPEYQSVEMAFRRTVPEGRIKIERLQNVHLRRNYEAQRKHISDKNANMGAAVEKDFRQTDPTGRIKIERLKNVHLRRAYEAQKKHISDKNANMGTEVEKVLYHGTTQDNCDSIMKSGFNRSFAGQNATVYGEGTYFAVKASYSAHHKYAKPAADGSQRIFVARVLTGIYTVGKSDIKVPPPCDILLPHDHYDSVVDRMDNPRIHVVFHDDQAYPDYLITILDTQLQEEGQAHRPFSRSSTLRSTRNKLQRLFK